MSSSGVNLENFLIPLEEINRATKNFSRDNFIGDGGFGAVYRGQLSERWENREAAVKRLDRNSCQGKDEFQNELQMISSFEHENIISFIGYCDEGNEMIIVSKYASNGSLDLHLKDPSKMCCITWRQRLEICLEAAQGLEYLHSGLGYDHRVIHRDIKSANILLDDNLVAKISDFGLSRLGPRNHLYTQVLTSAAGTQFYLDPVYHECGILNKESDVYSFGVVMFEMLSGMLVYSKRCIGDKPQTLISLVRCYYDDGLDKIIDPHISSQINRRSFDHFKEIAYTCISYNRKQRPTMDRIIKTLKKALQYQLESLIPMVAGLYSNDENRQLWAAIEFDRRLAKERIPSIEEVIQSGVIPRFVKFLMREDFPDLQFRSLAALTKITSGTSENIKIVIDYGVVPFLVKLLASSSDGVCIQACVALENIAGDSPGYRDLVLGQGAMNSLLYQLEDAHVYKQRRLTRTLARFFWKDPLPPFEQTRPALTALGHLIHSIDEEVLRLACLALSYLSHGTTDEVQAMVDAGFCQHLVELLLDSSPKVIFRVLQTLNNITETYDNAKIQRIVEHGALRRLLSLLTDNHNNKIKQLACSVIINIIFGGKEQIQAVIEAGLIPPLVNLIQTAPLDIRWGASCVICDVTIHATDEQIKYLVSEGCIKTMCDLLVHSDLEIMDVSLKVLWNILVKGEPDKNVGNTRAINSYAGLIVDAEGLEKIKNLQGHKNNKISKMAVEILEAFWPKELDVSK